MIKGGRERWEPARTCRCQWLISYGVRPSPKRRWHYMLRPEERFELVYRAHVVDLVGYVARRVPFPPDAPDVVAEVFTITWRRIGEIPDGPSVRPWLFGVARKVMANHRRGGQRRDRLYERLRAELRVVHGTLPHDSPIDADVRAALTRLSDDDRELLRLTAWEQLEPSEIAIAMGVPAGTIRRRLHDARNQLRRELQVATPIDPLVAIRTRPIEPACDTSECLLAEDP